MSLVKKIFSHKDVELTFCLKCDEIEIKMAAKGEKISQLVLICKCHVAVDAFKHQNKIWDPIICLVWIMWPLPNCPHMGTLGQNGLKLLTDIVSLKS